MANDLIAFTPAELALARRTVAKDCDDDEFRLFIRLCKATGLDPLRKQCYAFVFNKEGAKKGSNGKEYGKPRQLTLVTAIQGYRSIADRTGCYRPDEDEPEIRYLPEKAERDRVVAEAKRISDAKQRKSRLQEIEEQYPVDPLNPHGIEKALVRCWKFAQGGWHKVTGEAYWEEYAPVKEEWVKPSNPGESAYKTGKMILDPGKPASKMPRGWIAKCAEALALRKGWPDDYSNVYLEEETHRESARLDVVEAVGKYEEEARLARQARGARSIMIDFGDQSPIEMVPVEYFSRRCIAFIEENSSNPGMLDSWWSRNRNAIREFHGTPERKTEAVSIGKKLDEVMTAVRQIEAKKTEEQAAA
jgi:phage recombination protein Bet